MPGGPIVELLKLAHGQAPPVALIGQRRRGVAVAHDVSAAGQRRLNHLGHVLGSSSQHEECLGLRYRHQREVEQEPSQRFAHG